MKAEFIFGLTFSDNAVKRRPATIGFFVKDCFYKAL